MATAKLTLDKRYMSTTGTYPLVVELVHQRKTRYISLKMMLREDQWKVSEEKDAIGAIVNHPNSKRVTTTVQKKLSDIKFYLTINEQAIHSMNVNVLKEKIKKEVLGMGKQPNHGDDNGEDEGWKDNDEQKSVESKSQDLLSLQKYGDGLIKKLKATNDPSQINNAIWYKDGMNSFIKFNNGNDILMTQINADFLNDYKTHWLSKIYANKASINTLSARLRAIRTITNQARAEGIIPKSHTPFDEIEIPSSVPNKRAVDITVINKYRAHKVEAGTLEWHHKNYFLYMFNNQGMNFVDLAHLRVHQVADGRLKYIRSKTKRSKMPKKFDIKQTEEALNILSYYLPGKRPDDYVFPILNKELEKDGEKLLGVRNQALKVYNTTLKKFAKENGIPKKLTSYVVRHSWADIAKRSGASTEQIKDALGQGNVIITETYLNSFESDVLDKLNALVTSGNTKQAGNENENNLLILQEMLSKVDFSQNTQLRQSLLTLLLQSFNNELTGVNHQIKT